MLKYALVLLNQHPLDIFEGYKNAKSVTLCEVLLQLGDFRFMDHCILSLKLPLVEKHIETYLYIYRQVLMFYHLKIRRYISIVCK